MGKHKVIDFMFLYQAAACAAIGIFALFAHIWFWGAALLVASVAMFAFDRWTRKRGL
jgi:hypothetical protein